MPLVVLILAILGAVALLADFIVSEEDDKALKNKLADFFVAIEAGDWTALYRQPAKGLLRFMNHVLGDEPFSLRFVIATVAVSILMTVIFFSLALVWTYVHVHLIERHCRVPGIGQFLEIPGYMSSFLVDMTIVNILFDYLAWTLARWGLRVISATGGLASVLTTLLLFPLIAAGILWLMYALYLPMAIRAEAQLIGIPFGAQAFAQIFNANLHNIASFFAQPDYLFVIRCSANRLNPYASPDHPTFSISFINTMQIVATETMIPFILFFISCVFGILAYTTRPFTRRPLGLIVERVSGSEKHVFATIAAVLAPILAILAAIVTYRKQ